MYTVDWFRDKKITVMGLGVLGGGLGIATWLLRHGAELTVTDLRDQHALVEPMTELERIYLEEVAKQGKGKLHKIRYVLERHEEADFKNVDLVIQNPGVRRESSFLEVARSAKIPIEMDVALFMLLCPFPVIGITGTKGKTTVTTLLGQIAKLHDKKTVLGGNIRISPFDSLDKLLRLAEKGKEQPPVILELSSWHLEGLAPHNMSPHIGVLTNLKEDHLNRYKDFAEYIEAKSPIFAHQKGDDVAVLNADDEEVVQLSKKKNPANVLWFGASIGDGDGWTTENGKVVRQQNGSRTEVFALSDIQVPGEHNVSNVLAACAAAEAFGISYKTIIEGVKAFTGVSGRLEQIATKRGVVFVNDTTATMPDAAIEGMKALGKVGKKHIVLLAGGADKELRYDAWAVAAAEYVKAIIFFEGSASEKMKVALEKQGTTIPQTTVTGMTQAMQAAMEHANDGDIVLLSPGCASFGVFVNEFDRGKKFVVAVKKL